MVLTSSPVNTFDLDNFSVGDLPGEWDVWVPSVLVGVRGYSGNGDMVTHMKLGLLISRLLQVDLCGVA